MREINLAVIHCAATPPDMDIGFKEIDRWHRKRGWLGIGYHYVIRRGGELELGRDIEKSGAHARGYNFRSIGICLVGGVTQEDITVAENNFTKAQLTTLSNLTLMIQQDYPSIEFCGHNALTDSKTCPNFDWEKFLTKLGRPVAHSL